MTSFSRKFILDQGLLPWRSHGVTSSEMFLWTSDHCRDHLSASEGFFHYKSSRVSLFQLFHLL